MTPRVSLRNVNVCKSIRSAVIFQSILFVLIGGFPTLSAAQTQSTFLGSVPTGQVSATPVNLSLQDAFARALKYNLGAIESDQETRAAHAARLRGLNALLPNLTARISYLVQQIYFPAEGFSFSIPGAHIPTVVGPFAVQDARGDLSQEIFNWSDTSALEVRVRIRKGVAVYVSQRPRPRGANHRQRISRGDFRCRDR